MLSFLLQTHTPLTTMFMEQNPKGTKKNGSRSKPQSKEAANTAQKFSASNGTTAKPDNPGDYWTPQVTAPTLSYSSERGARHLNK